jgi:hypothetical protein
MQAVATEFEDRTFRYVQIERQGDIAIYCQTHKIGVVDRYEVVRIRVKPAYAWPDGHVTPEREAYPGSTRWGQDGWTFFRIEAARAFAARLAQEQDESVI